IHRIGWGTNPRWSGLRSTMTTSMPRAAPCSTCFALWKHSLMAHRLLAMRIRSSRVVWAGQ
ncbi:hypothetical protein ABZ557_32150, partial [Streptomyces sp. NPDC019645]|uniref:hypothetical protein n=1 Tax=Streptomyces sp. NPDC019645 TaxID=3154786 RepID=UPI0033DE322C